MAIVLIGYGIVLAGLGLALQDIAMAPGRVASIAGLSGGGLSLLLGVMALAGLKGRVWATLSLSATAAVMLTQTVHVWMTSPGDGAGSLTVRLFVTAMLLLTLGMLMYLLHGERSPEFYQSAEARRDSPASGRIDGQAREGRSHR